jgi:hypothetical protein
VRNGSTLFWTDNWVHGQKLERLVPHLFGAITGREKERTVFDAVTDMRWVSDIRGALTVDVLAEYLGVRDRCYNLRYRTRTFGASLPLENIQQNLHMRPCSSDPLNSILGTEYGKPRPQASAIFLCGWLHMTDAGQLIGWLGKDCLILQNVLYVIRRMKR